MLDPKILLKHFGLFWLVFISLQLLVSSAPVRNGLAGFHAPVFSKTTQLFLSDVKMQAQAEPKSGEIRFSFYSELELAEKAAEMKKTGKSGNVGVTKYEYVNNPRFHVNTAMVFLLALFLATPLGWKNRLLLAGVGALMFYGFSSLRMVLNLRTEIGKMGIGLYESQPGSMFSWQKMHEVVGALGFIFMLTILVWALLVFTKSNIGQMKRYLS